MPVTAEQPAPYAPASAILGIVHRHRTRGLPGVIDADVLERAGITKSLIPRTLHALRSLDLIDDDGRPSQILERIRLAPEGEFKQRLTEWLNGAYADALQFADPASDGEEAVRDAFRKYTPIGQQPRMVSLFIGLFAAAGIGPDKKPATTRKLQNVSSGRAVVARVFAGAALPSKTPALPQLPTAGNLPPAMAGLLASLPKEGGWTQEQRDKFVTTFSVVIDFCIPITASQTNTEAGLS